MASDQPRERTVIGAMTGTSIDGIDLALARITGRGLSLRAQLIAHIERPLGDLANTLRPLAAGEPMIARDIARAALALGELHAQTIDSLLKSLPDAPTPDLIAVHGQTVFHHPPVSWQLINPAPIAARFACPVVFDLRQADLAAGGQGAPITPIADWIMFRHESRRRAIVNLGGFCNLTILPAAGHDRDSLRHIDGFDLCPCNQLLDAIARQSLGAPYDDHGVHARSGTVNDAAARDLDQRLRAQHRPPEHQPPQNQPPQHRPQRSLGTGDEAFNWLAQHTDHMTGSDLAATAISVIARRIGDVLAPANVDDIILAGGGTRNDALVNAIRVATSPTSLTLGDAHGIPATAREALAMAILGALAQDDVPITLPHITGCHPSPDGRAPLAGVWIHRAPLNAATVS